MALEPITRQEQIIAGKDLEPITRMEKFLKEYGGGGGAFSWNDLDDRPFGEETVYGDTLTWDGNTVGLESVSASELGGGDGFYYRISNATPTLDDFANGYSTTVEGSTNELTQDTVQDIGNGLLMVAEVFWIVPYDNFELTDEYGTISVEKKGFYNNPLNVLSFSLTINGYNGFETKVVKPIDNKYLEPFETVGGDTFTWDGNTEGLEVAEGVYYKVSDIVPTMEYCANGGVITVSDGRSLNVVNKEVMQDGTNIIIKPGNAPCAIVVTSDADGFSPGLYLLNAEGMYVASLKINGYTGFTTTKLKEEYIPVDYIKQLIAEVTGN